MRIKYLYILLLLLLSCAKEADWEPETSIDEHLIVDGIITNEGIIQDIYLKYSRAQLDEDAVPLSNADVIVNNEDSTWRFIEKSDEPGRYQSQRKITALSGKNYSLLILFDGKVYSAQSYMVPGKAFSELDYKKNDDNNLYHIDYVASAFEEDDPAMWEIFLDWSEVPGYEDHNPDDCRKRYCFIPSPHWM